MRKRLIIINRMYAGKYLTEGENIGHEIINLIRSDNGNNYLWLNADGNCDVSRFMDKRGNLIYDEIVVLLVRMYGYRQWKVLGKAEIDTAALTDYMVPQFSEKYHRLQIERIHEENISYGGQPLDRIFENNYFNGVIQSGIDIYFTFKARNVFLPVSTPENIDKTIINIDGLRGLANQSLRMYLTDENASKKDTYDKFNDIVNGKVFIWETENTTQKANVNSDVTVAEKEFFLKILNEEYRELSFSNLLAYFLKNKKVMASFVKQTLGLKNFNEDAYSIAREEKNIDLFISSPEHYIIIENKIRSGLIEEKKKMDKLILDYFGESEVGKLSSKATKILNAFRTAETHFQTDRYYAYACGMVERRKSHAKISGYVLCPNYSLHTIAQQMQNALFSENYKTITYEQVYSFFNSLKDSDILTANENKYLGEFLCAMEIHTKDVDNTFEEEMENRFYKKIKASNAGS